MRLSAFDLGPFYLPFSILAAGPGYAFVIIFIGVSLYDTFIRLYHSIADRILYLLVGVIYTSAMAFGIPAIVISKEPFEIQSWPRFIIGSSIFISSFILTLAWYIHGLIESGPDEDTDPTWVIWLWKKLIPNVDEKMKARREHDAKLRGPKGEERYRRDIERKKKARAERGPRRFIIAASAVIAIVAIAGYVRSSVTAPTPAFTLGEPFPDGYVPDFGDGTK